MRPPRSRLLTSPTPIDLLSSALPCLTQAIEKNLGAPIIPSWEGCHPINLARNANRKSVLKLLRAPIVVAQGDGADG